MWVAKANQEVTLIWKRAMRLRCWAFRWAGVIAAFLAAFLAVDKLVLVAPAFEYIIWKRSAG